MEKNGSAYPKVRDLSDRVDPEIREIYKKMPHTIVFTPENIVKSRKMADRVMDRMTPAGANKSDENVIVTKHTVPSVYGEPDITLYLYEARTDEKEKGVFVNIHGGGMVSGRADQFGYDNKIKAGELGCIVMSPEYRLCPETPYPGQVHDCYSALVWLWENAAELGVDRNRIAVGGESAGGCLAAGITLMARDLNGPKICYLDLSFPMLDCTCSTQSVNEMDDDRAWNGSNTKAVWPMYLGALRPEDAPAYASPAMAADLSGLPPTHVAAAELDPLRDEDIEFAHRLLKAGVSTELHVYPGTFHGFCPANPNAAVCRRFLAEGTECLKNALKK